MIASFAASGIRWNGGAQGEELLRTIRATYEPLLDALSHHLLISQPGWIVSDEQPDHWERGPRGIIARRLVESLAAGGTEGAPLKGRSRGRTVAQRLRSRPKR